ncbi:MAG: biotin/lipoyl-containing protein [bacterium]
MTSQFNYESVEELVQMMEQWQVGELHLTVAGESVDIVRRAPVVQVYEDVDGSEYACEEIQPAVSAEPSAISSTMVGIFHPAKRGAVRVGDAVIAGQIVGSIELMHVPNDLASPISGTICEILVEDGAGVEYGQILMLVKPYSEVGEDEAAMLPSPR